MQYAVNKYCITTYIIKRLSCRFFIICINIIQFFPVSIISQCFLQVNKMHFCVSNIFFMVIENTIIPYTEVSGTAITHGLL